MHVVAADSQTRKALCTAIRALGLAAKGHCSATEALEVLEPEAPGCLLVDLDLPDKTAFEFLEEWIYRDAVSPVIMMGSGSDVSSIVGAVKAGAFDYLRRPIRPVALGKSLREALATSTARTEDRPRRVLRSRISSLTRRQREVFERLVTGQTNKKIALALGISFKTVEFHRALVMRKMKADSIAELARMAERAR